MLQIKIISILIVFTSLMRCTNLSSTTLGVDVLEYAPYAFFNYLNPIIAVAMAAMGIGLLNIKDKAL